MIDKAEDWRQSGIEQGGIFGDKGMVIIESVRGEKPVEKEGEHRTESGRLIGELLTACKLDPGISERGLMNYVTTSALESRLSGPDLGRNIHLVKQFCRDRALVSAIQSEGLSPKDLFKRTFGFSPVGEVRVIFGTMDIAFYVPNIEDRAGAMSGGGKLKADLTHRTAAGGVVPFVADSRLNGLAIVLEYHDVPEDLEHERQHIVNHRLIDLYSLQKPSKYAGELMGDANGRMSMEKARECLEAYRLSRLVGQVDEIFAMCRQNHMRANGGEKIINVLLSPNSSYGQRLRGVSADFLQKMLNLIDPEEGEDFLRLMESVNYQEQDRIVMNAVNVVTGLLDRGDSLESVIGKLCVIPINEWTMSQEESMKADSRLVI